MSGAARAASQRRCSHNCVAVQQDNIVSDAGPNSVVRAMRKAQITIVPDQNNPFGARQIVQHPYQIRVGRGIVDHDNSRLRRDRFEHAVEANRQRVQPSVHRDHHADRARTRGEPHRLVRARGIDIQNRHDHLNRAGSRRPVGWKHRGDTRCRHGRRPRFDPRIDGTAHQVASAGVADVEGSRMRHQRLGRDRETAWPSQGAAVGDDDVVVGGLQAKQHMSFGGFNRQCRVPRGVRGVPRPSDQAAVARVDKAFAARDRSDIDRTADKRGVVG